MGEGALKKLAVSDPDGDRLIEDKNCRFDGENEGSSASSKRKRLSSNDLEWLNVLELNLKLLRLSSLGGIMEDLLSAKLGAAAGTPYDVCY